MGETKIRNRGSKTKGMGERMGVASTEQRVPSAGLVYQRAGDGLFDRMITSSLLAFIHSQTKKLCYLVVFVFFFFLSPLPHSCQPHERMTSLT